MEHQNFVIIHYNVHSLIRFDERLERFLTELGDQQWDLLVFTETWRADSNEAFNTQHGHAWFGSGATKGQRGVGFLLHSPWPHRCFKPVSKHQ